MAKRTSPKKEPGPRPRPAARERRKTEAAARSGEPEALIANAAPSHDEIARRAYEIWRGRGAAPGSGLEDWLQAERELTEGRRSEAS